MFVRSRVDKPLIFRKGGKSWTLKPHAVTLISDPTVTARELKGCYGSRIDVISDEGVFDGSKEGRQPVKNAVKYSKVEKPTVKEEVIKKPIDKTLDDILEEVNKELADDSEKVDTEKNTEHGAVKLGGTANDAASKCKDPEISENNIGDDGGTSKTSKKTSSAKKTSSGKVATRRRARNSSKKKSD